MVTLESPSTSRGQGRAGTGSLESCQLESEAKALSLRLAAPPAKESQEDGGAYLPRPLSLHPPSAHSGPVKPCGELQPGPYTLSTLASWGRDRGPQNGVVVDPAWGPKLPWEYPGAWQPSRASHSLP